MAKPLSERQRDYRSRKAAEPERLREALRAIIAKLGDKNGEVAAAVRKIALEALGIEDSSKSP